MNKAILITNIPTPYRIPLFNVLHEELRNREVGFKVIFGALGNARRQWRIDMQECSFPHDVFPAARRFTYKGLFRVIKKERPGVIITNGFSIATTKLWLRSFVYRTPYIIWSGAIRSPETSGSLPRRLHRQMLVRRASGFVAYSSRAKDYLLDLGASTESISIGINTVDTAHFGHVERRALKKDEKQRLLFVGELIPRKGLDRLLGVIKLVAGKREDFVLDVVGAGAEQARLEQMVQDLGIAQHVNFVGFKQKQEMPEYLERASCFVFPTRHDIWGLVLVEAMAAGLPSISSIDAGATSDLIQDGKTGFSVDFSETDRVAEKLMWVLDHPAESALMGERARKFIEQNVTLEKSAEGFVAAIERVLQKKI